MSAHVQASILALEQELEATQQRAALIERSLEGLREIYGIPDIAEPPAKRKYTRRAAPPKKGKGRRAIKKTDRPTDRPSKARANGASLTTPRSLPNHENHVESVVGAVRRAGGVMRPKELAGALKISPLTQRTWTAEAIKAKAVVQTGARFSCRISLPGKSPAKEDL